MSYVSSSEKERREMLDKIGVASFEELITEIPESLRLKRKLDIPAGKSELEVSEHLRKLAGKNESCADQVNFMGAGAYDHYIPAAVDALISRSEYLTAYTPYQAEVSQGTLQTIYEYQSLVCRLTGMDIANASMYDGASATAEAVLMALTLTKNNKVCLAPGLHPNYRAVIDTYTSGIDVEFIEPENEDGSITVDKLSDIDFDQVACVVVQSPNFYGVIEDIKSIGKLLADKKAMFVVVSNPVALALLTTPGEAGADIAVGEMQVFGNCLNLGGPYVGYFAARKKLMRQIPGRLAARTEDVKGEKGYVLTLQTREQHIRREKATSNICTNQALCALAATIHLSLIGKSGLIEMAKQSVRKAHYLAEKLALIDGIDLVYKQPFFHEFVIKLPVQARDFMEKMQSEKILAGVPMARFYTDRNSELLVAVTEKRSREDLDLYVRRAEEIAKQASDA
ncbi:MAG: aminomethyl-transferring glycine dehydrogenase subunit GcvPA [candidate division Zixibacteria bacterium]|nr:aminomethyl-transferring glycine dehydrogenase subunit GcvPA [candidate division Zixibacteria bacterium]